MRIWTGLNGLINTHFVTEIEALNKNTSRKIANNLATYANFVERATRANVVNVKIFQMPKGWIYSVCVLMIKCNGNHTSG